ATPPTTPTEGSVRVVADPGTNSLLVKANALDLLTIKRLLAKAIDQEPEGDAVISVHTRQLKDASATDVATVLKEVYQQQTGNSPTTTNVGNFPGLAFPGFGNGFGGGFNRGGFGNGGQQGQNTGTQKLALQLGVDDRTNTLVCQCSAAMWNDIDTLCD